MTEAPDTLDLADRLLDAQAAQHKELISAIKDNTSASKDAGKVTNARLGNIENELHNKPGKLEVRAVMLALLGVFLLMLNSFLQSKGVDTEKAGNEARKMLAPTMDLISQPTPAAPPSTEMPDDGQHLTP